MLYIPFVPEEGSIAERGLKLLQQRTYFEFRPVSRTVNSPYIGHCRELWLVTVLISESP